MQAPIDQGPAKRRRIGSHLKEAVAQAALEGDLGRSGFQAMAVMSRAKHWGLKRHNVGNTLQRDIAARYWKQVQAVCGVAPCPKIGVVWAATRAVDFDYMFWRLWMMQHGIAWLLPRQVGTGCFRFAPEQAPNSAGR